MKKPAKKATAKKKTSTKKTVLSESKFIDLLNGIYLSDKKRTREYAKDYKVDGNKLWSDLADSDFEIELREFIWDWFQNNKMEFESLEVKD